jgi:DNA replication initiation complex subunit (GINS family)
METSELITIWRAEKGNNVLTAISKDFYTDSLAFLDSIGQNSFEYAKANDIYKGIVGIRQHKMLMAVLRELEGNDRPENMSSAEVEGYVKILNTLQSIRSGKESSETVCLTRNDGLNETKKGQEVLENPKKKEEPLVESSQVPEKSEGTVTETNTHCIDSEDYEKGGFCGHENLEDLNKIFGSEDDTIPTENAKETAQRKEDEKENEVFKQEAENKGDVIRVRFLKPMPAFVGPDLETLGPFEEEQVLEIVKEIAEILLKNDAVEEA